MVKKLSSIILVFSLALNLAFVGVWGYHRFYLRPRMRRWRDRDFDARERRGWHHDDDHDDEDHHHRWRKGSPLEEKLDLDEGQRGAVRNARRELAVKMKKRTEAVEERREELFELLLRPDVERTKVENALKELNEARGGLTRATVEHMLQLKKVLKPEQARRLLEMIRKRTAGHGRALREFVGGRGKGPRPHPERDGGRRRRRRGAPPRKRDSHGPKEPGRQR